MGIFKPCDIRGIYPDELDEETAEAIGRAIGSELAGRDCVVGGDVRLSTPPLKAAVCEGLGAAGVRVLDVGTLPTPVAYWARRHLDASGVAVVTASHNPPDYNGVKLMMDSPWVTPGDVDRVRLRVESGEFRSGTGGLERRDVHGDYMAWLARRFRRVGQGLRVLVDAGNGCASDWAPTPFRAAAYEVDRLFCEPDGSFPNRSPDPSKPEAVAAAAERVRQRGAHFGVCFDGDADRAVFLDERGEFVPAEQTLILLARAALVNAPGGAVVYDQKCTRVVPDQIQRAGGRPLRERSGHAFIKRRLIEEQAVLAGEASGHFFFPELGGDDGIYAALKVGQILAAADRPFSELRETIPPYFISEDIRIPCPADEARAALQRLRDAFADRPQDTTDGVRIEFEGGWALCRPSVTEPALTVRAEGDTAERMEQIRGQVLDALGL